MSIYVSESAKPRVAEALDIARRGELRLAILEWSATIAFALVAVSCIKYLIS